MSEYKPTSAAQILERLQREGGLHDSRNWIDLMWCLEEIARLQRDIAGDSEGRFKLAEFTAPKSAMENVVQCRCGWWGKVSALKLLPHVDARACPDCSAVFAPVDIDGSLWQAVNAP